ncbi:unnamed protein product [Penicillium camemberti]|uniref:Str. FM013 n=1 Tax=Penicillium camemberti (strain FM 013) TaxID=1429867 RepID=A0A0G4PTK2_PENC3|nr:unnamed protein product [Penicillium camemberti]
MLIWFLSFPGSPDLESHDVHQFSHSESSSQDADQGPKLSLQAARSRNTDAIDPLLALWHASWYCSYSAPATRVP